MSTWQARVMVAGEATGKALWLQANISFWGGVSPLDGTIIDARHPQFGQAVGGRILLLERSIGSSSGSSVLLELLSRGCGPAGIILGEPEQILTLGAVVAREMSYAAIPVVQLDAADFGELPAILAISRNGRISTWTDAG
jgi:hypothetical protein